MDNFHIDITSEGDVNLERALLIAFSGRSGGAVGYAVREAHPGEMYPADDQHEWVRNTVKVPARGRRLILFWGGPGNDAAIKDFVALPFKLDAAGAADFVRRWLKEQDFGKQPDHDGDNGRGWRLYNEAWGHVESQWQAFVAISPAWAMYGK